MKKYVDRWGRCVILFYGKKSNELESLIYLDNKERVVKFPTFYIRRLNKKSKFSKKSLKQYAKILLYFCKHIEDLSVDVNTSVDEMLCVIEGAHIENYIKLMKDSGIKNATIRNRDVVIKGFMEWLTSYEAGAVRAESGYFNGELKSAVTKNKVPLFLTTEEIINFCMSMHEESQRCLVHFLYDCGVRISEVPRIKKSDIPDLSNYPEDQMYFELHIRGSKGRGGEEKARYTMISRAMIQRINLLHNNWKVYIKASTKMKAPPCFLNVDGEMITVDAIKSLLRAVAIRRNLKPSKYSPHKFRHSFAVSILKSELGRNYQERLVIVKESLGHQDIKTTEMYLTIPVAALENLRALDKGKGIRHRFEDSQEVFNRTYKPQKLHFEKRGRK
jgi:integrase/recombinase XerD